MKTLLQQKLTKLLSVIRLQQILLVLVGLLVVGTVAYFGTHQKQASKAATPGTMYVTPATGTHTTGTNITVAIREESGTSAVNSVQAALVYNPAHLQYVSVTDSAVFPFVAATSTSTPGEVRLARGTGVGAPGVAGDNLVATVTFKVLAGSGTTSLSFNDSFSLIVRSSDSANIMTSSIGASYSIVGLPPNASSITPSSGPMAGGTTVTITGTNFVNGVQVNFGTRPATSVTFVSSTQLSAVTPSSTSSGAVGVEMVNPDGQRSTKGGGFTYIAPAPTISTVSPASGPTTGGTTITITGTNFVSGASVRIGTTNATSVNFVSSTTLQAVTPAHPNGGLKDVTVFNPDQQSATKTGAFTYTLPAPMVSGLAPRFGFITGGLITTLTGTNFVSGAQVKFGGVAATNVLFVNGTTLTVTVPAHAAGSVAVAVTNPDGQTGTLANGFDYNIMGDTNGDDRVNGIDYSVLASHDGEAYPAADFNADGIVGAPDLAILLANWTW